MSGEDDSSPTLIADLGVKGVWTPQAEALFDVRVTDTDASSYVNHSVAAVLASAEEEKKRKYLSAAESRRSSFTPFIVSVDGALGHQQQGAYDIIISISTPLKNYR